MKKFSVVAFGILFFAAACSSERNTFTNRTFHNLTAHYNAYYLAEVKLKEVEAEVATNYKEDYTQVLPVFIPIDSASIQANQEKLQSSRELASKAIEWHKISKWVDDSYYLLGKIDYYQSHFDDAQNTFKYVNVNSKEDDVRHKTLITLLKLYVDLGEIEKANFTIDYLSKESDISEENRYELYRTLAYYYETRQDKNGIIGALDKALEYASDKKEESRINFILAQRYQRIGLDALAYDYYKKALEGNPPYERSFFAQLYAQQVAELNASKDLKKVRNYYEELYKDPKNRDLKDVVIYERALFEEKQGDTEVTLSLLHQAAKEPGSNPRLKGYIYQKLAEINLEQFKDYRSTKYYLDSALTFINTSDPITVQIQEQKISLDNYVFHFERIDKNDSLITLAKMSPEDQRLVAENFIKSEEERLMAEAKAAEKPRNTSLFDNLLAFSDRGSGSSTFYFDNGVAMQQGAIEFRRTWGNRPLQDNWRRSAVSFQSSAPTIPEPSENDSTALDSENNPLSNLPDLESLLSEIPNSPDQLNELNLQLEESYFELGKLLYFNLDEVQQSINNLETLVRLYPGSSRKPEAYYLLYLGQKDLGGNSQQYVTRLNREFPSSQYTFSVNNPQAASGNMAYLESSQRYQKAYEAYYSGQYQTTKELIQSTLEEYPLTRNTERLILLDIMVTGKTESRAFYRERLEAYILNAQNEGLKELAKNMLNPLLSDEELAALNPKKLEISDSTALASEEVTELEDSVDLAVSPFKVNNSQTHIFVVAMSPSEAEEAKNLLGDLENFHAKNFSNSRLRTGNMNMNRENAIYIISPFSNAEKALDYFNIFQKDFESEGMSTEVKVNSFFISIENFQVLNKSKNLEEYRTFFKSVYK
jgi:tetratricopeptide (TPR) repeat protein